MIQNPRYAGFISYSQKDKNWALRIHRALEAYRLPIRLPDAKEPSKRLGRFFRDDDELSGAASLGSALEEALDNSKALIVVCSPNSARSKWVDLEIRRFKKRVPDSKVFAVIVAGRPDADDPEERCFPPSLLRKVAPDGTLTDEVDEPLAPDVTKDRFPRLITRLVAGLVGIEFDTLWRRERRRTIRRRIIAATLGTLLVTGAFAGAIAWRTAEQGRLAQESVSFAKEAQIAMKEGRVEAALNLVLESLPASLENPDRPVVPAATAALIRLMADNPARGIVARFEEPVRSIRHLNEGRLGVQLESGSIHVIDAANGDLLTRLPSERLPEWLSSTGLAGVSWNEEYQDQDGLWHMKLRAQVYDLATGAEVRSLEGDNADWWLTRAISARGTYVLATATSGNETPDGLAIFKTGVADALAVSEPAYNGAAPFIDGDGFLRAAFAGEEAVAFSWGAERRGLGIWRFMEEAPRLLAAAGAPPPCGGAIADSNNRSDITSLSPDRGILSLAQPVDAEGWCVSLWRTSTGEPLPSVLFDQAEGGLLALTEDMLVTAGGYFFSNKEIRHRDGQSWEIRNCPRNITGTLDLSAKLDGWIIDPEARISACAEGKTIMLRGGAHFVAQPPLLGHGDDVRALAFDSETWRLWSGGDDGTLRLWQLRPLVSIDPDLSAVQLVTGGGRAAALFRGADDNFVLQVFDADGVAVSPRISIHLVQIEGSETPPARELKLYLLAGGKTLGVAEGFLCGFGGCSQAVNRRLTLIRVTDGRTLRTLDNVAPGKFSTDDPVAVIRAPGGHQATALMSNGSALLFDTLTGDTKSAFGLPEGAKLEDTAFAHSTWWFLSSDSPDEPYTRQTRLLLDDGNGDLKEITRRQAQDGELFAAPDGSILLAQYDIIHDQNEPVAMTVYLGRDLSLPVALQSKKVQYKANTVLFPAPDLSGGRRIALFFGDISGLSPLMVDAETGDMKPLATSQRASASPIWRVDDPLGRALISTDDGRLSITPYNSERPLCPALIDSPADQGAISANGRYLAIASHAITVYDLDICEPIRVIPFDVTFRSLDFADNSNLWALDRDDMLHIINLDHDPAQLLSNARSLASRSRE